jgi:hypothetical protein
VEVAEKGEVNMSAALLPEIIALVEMFVLEVAVTFPSSPVPAVVEAIPPAEPEVSILPTVFPLLSWK